MNLTEKEKEILNALIGRDFIYGIEDGKIVKEKIEGVLLCEGNCRAVVTREDNPFDNSISRYFDGFGRVWAFYKEILENLLALLELGETLGYDRRNKK